MGIRKKIEVSTDIEFYHCWPGAPEEVRFLRNVHRHMLHVSVTIEVFHNDRELEFIMVKRFVNELLADIVADCEVSTSCEDIATALLLNLCDQYGSERFYEISVKEDNENGAIVTYEKDNK